MNQPVFHGMLQRWMKSSMTNHVLVTVATNTLMVLNMYGNPWCAGLSLQAGIPTRHCHCNMSGNPLEICFDEFKVYTVW